MGSNSQLLSLCLLEEVSVEEDEERVHLRLKRLWGSAHRTRSSNTRQLRLRALGQSSLPARCHGPNPRRLERAQVRRRRKQGRGRDPSRVRGRKDRTRGGRTFFWAGSWTPATIRLSSLRIALAATPVVADLKSYGIAARLRGGRETGGGRREAERVSGRGGGRVRARGGAPSARAPKRGDRGTDHGRVPSLTGGGLDAAGGRKTVRGGRRR